MDRWTIHFYLGKRELVEKLTEFLGARLNPAYKFGKSAGKVDVDGCRDQSEAWRVALWIHHNSSMKPRFVIEALDDSGKVTYNSDCKTCREAGGNHGMHVGS
jgi:hypothetical protein